MAKFATAAWYILTPESNLGPKRLTVIEMLAVTKFVNDHVPGEMQRQELELVVKIKIPFCRTTPPAALRVLDRHATVGHTDTQSFSLYHWYEQGPRCLFVIEVGGPLWTRYWCRPAFLSDATSYRTPQLLHITSDTGLVPI